MTKSLVIVLLPPCAQNTNLIPRSGASHLYQDVPPGRERVDASVFADPRCLQHLQEAPDIHNT